MREITLERARNVPFLCAVRRDRLVMGITTGVVPAAAIVGMLVGFGLRMGRPRAFDVLGRGVIGRVLVVVLLMLLCDVAYVAVVARERQLWVAWAIAIGAAAVVVIFSYARLTAGDIALVLSTRNLIAIAVVIAITLPVGMRFAFLSL